MLYNKLLAGIMTNDYNILVGGNKHIYRRQNEEV
jgi:hypothetical protein